VASINAEPRNPSIKLEGTPFYLQAELGEWEEVRKEESGERYPRRSLINSFGAGGAYASVVLEEYVREEEEIGGVEREERLYVFSAKTEWSLQKYLERMEEFLRRNGRVEPEEVEYSLMRINNGLEKRAAIVAEGIGELIEKLRLLQERRESIDEAGIYISLDSRREDVSTEVGGKECVTKKDILRATARRWVNGVAIDLRELQIDEHGPCISLPKYAFDHNIEFGFDSHKSILNLDSDAHQSAQSDEMVEFDEELYRSLLSRLSAGELSKYEALQLVQEEKVRA
jgi:acyl transferase domain-containing protein